MEFHPFFGRIVVPFGFLPHGNGGGFQYHVPVIPVDGELAPDNEALPHLHAVHDGLSVVAGHELRDADGTGVIGDLKADDPCLPLFELPVLHKEDVALHRYLAHIQIQRLHGYDIAGVHLPAEEVRPLPSWFFPRRGRIPFQLLERLTPDGLGAGEGVVRVHPGG
ncbi:hypothetical protein SDC9_55620 [bioreactor metagenome]|uniref:Uncharacterized protein n=1 Tax=bioreactor metagenome TaxID=1076179 RepID=A0A644X591_9ZZZZ